MFTYNMLWSFEHIVWLLWHLAMHVLLGSSCSSLLRHKWRTALVHRVLFWVSRTLVYRFGMLHNVIVILNKGTLVNNFIIVARECPEPQQHQTWSAGTIHCIVSSHAVQVGKSRKKKRKAKGGPLTLRHSFRTATLKRILLESPPSVKYLPFPAL